MCARARLQLGEQVPHVGLHRLLREEEPVADLTIDEALRDQLEDFDLSGGRLLLELLEGSRERDDLTRTARRPPLGDGLEAPRVIHVPTEDLFALSSVHEPRIGLLWTTHYSPFRGMPRIGATNSCVLACVVHERHGVAVTDPHRRIAGVDHEMDVPASGVPGVSELLAGLHGLTFVHRVLL